MAVSSIIQPTVFPTLDDRVSPIQRKHRNETTSRKRDLSFTANHIAFPRGRDDLLESYSRFIASYTGRRGVAFQYVLRTQLYHAIESQAIQARRIEEEPPSDDERSDAYIIDVLQHGQDDTTSYDFGLELIADVNNFASVEAPSQLHCVSIFSLWFTPSPFLVQYHAMEMTMTLRYDTNLMDEQYADTAFKTLVNHLSRTLFYTDQEIRLSILDHAPLRQSLSHEDGAEAQSLHSMFQKTAKEHPTRRALDYRSENTQFTMTYRQLDTITTALAHKLLSSIPRSQHTQVIVPVYMETSPEFYISWLAVLKAGFAICPLPVGAPALQLQSIVEDTCASVVLTSGPMLCGCPWDAWYCDDDDLSTYLDVNEFITTWTQTPHVFECKPLPSITDTDLAFVMYSSNSSAIPTGVTMTHQAASSTIKSYSKQISSHMRNRGFRWLVSSSPISHTSILEIFTTWGTGGTVCAVSQTLDLTIAISNVSATATTATSSQASTLDLARIPSLRHLWCVDTVPTSLNQQLRDILRPTYSALTVLKIYTTSDDRLLTGVISHISSSSRRSIIGSPLPGTSVFFLHPRTKIPVPLGAVGDLYIGGAGLPSGYIDRPDLNMAVFLPHPVYDRLYKTGDRGRLVKDDSGKFVVDLIGASCSTKVKEEENDVVKKVEERASGRDSVASMVDSLTEACVIESEQKFDLAEANVLSLMIGKTCV
ncbi:acetyl-CoA synthetase-like protein [Aureobasidium sp. EXF-8845]|nr:acetyl-CoA synthetase-like protein [Aureobasidium sp. EXF-8845]KAI4844976.1 acetyl-CoA synthetase-like protein [Aureobasidium sp. EXF-8846]